MPRPKPQYPSDAELNILDVLWKRGPSTVRQVHDVLHDERNASIGYTTVLKLMQIMAHKGIVDRDESQRSHIYRPSNSQQNTQGGLVEDLIDRAFSGSSAQLVLRALADRPVSTDELAEIRRFLDENDAGKAGRRRRR